MKLNFYLFFLMFIFNAVSYSQNNKEIVGDWKLVKKKFTIESNMPKIDDYLNDKIYPQLEDLEKGVSSCIKNFYFNEDNTGGQNVGREFDTIINFDYKIKENELITIFQDSEDTGNFIIEFVNNDSLVLKLNLPAFEIIPDEQILEILSAAYENKEDYKYFKKKKESEYLYFKKQ